MEKRIRMVTFSGVVLDIGTSSCLPHTREKPVMSRIIGVPSVQPPSSAERLEVPYTWKNRLLGAFPVRYSLCASLPKKLSILMLPCVKEIITRRTSFWSTQPLAIVWMLADPATPCAATAGPECMAELLIRSSDREAARILR